MDKSQILDEIFNNDPLGLLVVKPKASYARNADERLLTSFQEINDFFDKNKREPNPTPDNISEYQLYSRLKNFRESDEKMLALEPVDQYHLLMNTKTELNSIDDIFADETFNLLAGDSEGLFDFKHTPKDYDRAMTDFVARRKPCKDFENYEQLFKNIQNDLVTGKRKQIEFKQKNLVEGSFYVHNGVIFLLEKIDISQKEHYREDGTRVREDGRTRCIFENGTESNMLKRSVEKILYANGKVITENIQNINEGFLENFGTITDEDKEAGYIYVLKSRSTDSKVLSYPHLYKIGYSKTDVAERIKNAEKEPTYLMASVEYITGWKCFNMNPQKFELLIHNFFGNSCLELDVFDEKGKRHTPREWFIAPLDVIEQGITLIINGKVVNYKYDSENLTIVKR
jgi:hypothetical protein